MIKLRDKETGRVIGEISEADKPDIAALLQFASDHGEHRVDGGLGISLRNACGVGDGGHQFVLVHQNSLP